MNTCITKCDCCRADVVQSGFAAICPNCCAALSRLQATVTQQAEDVSLWFEATTAPEAYLQQSLRLLHTAVEDLSKSETIDICGFCGEGGADKMPHPVHWPGEESAGTELVHAECEREECARAHSALSQRQRDDFLRSI